jgi:hypothetical protein
MSTAVTNSDNKQPVLTPARQFRATCTAIATSLLTDWVGEERAADAIGRVSIALSAAAASSKKPDEFYNCTKESIGSVVAISALTGIMVGTTRNALAYAIPRRARKGEPPILRYELSHRGIAALAKRCDQALIPIPISYKDDIGVDDGGEAVVKSRDIDNPPATMDDLRGVVVLVKDRTSGIVTFRGWVPKSVIELRRNQSDAYRFALANDWARESDPWHKWPIEQSMKTAMHYAVSRGWCVIDDVESVRALSIDSENSFGGAEVIQGTAKRLGLDDLTERLIASSVDPEQEPEAPVSEAPSAS